MPKNFSRFNMTPIYVFDGKPPVNKDDVIKNRHEKVSLAKEAIEKTESQVMKNQLRKVPKLTFYIDDSLDYIENIDSALKNRENPIFNIAQNKSKQTK